MGDALSIFGGPHPPAPRGVEWIDTETAARRSGRSERTIGRKCGEEWLAAGKAYLEGKKWWVREDADPAFARVRFPEHMPFDLRQLPAERRRELSECVQALQGWEEALGRGTRAGVTERRATADYLRFLELDRGLKVSRRTLYEWRHAYRKAGFAGLVDRRWKGSEAAAGAAPGGGGEADDLFQADLRKYYLHTNRRSRRLSYELAVESAQRRGVAPAAVPSWWHAYRYMKSLPKAVVAKYRGGEKAYVDDAEPYVERDYSTLASNETWCADHHQFDVIVDAGGGRLVRPWLTAWMDMRSRKIVGWEVFAHDPNGDTVLATFRAAVLEHGVPEGVYLDNGKDMDCFAFHGRTKFERRRRIKSAVDERHAAGVFTALGVKATFCWTYHGQSKPIERFFGTLEDRFGRTFATYCGNRPENKPEGLAARLKRGEAPDLASFREDFGRWLAAGYHARPHAGDGRGGKTPDVVYQENLRRKRTADRDTLDWLLLKPTRPVQVGQNGVTWQDIRYGAKAPELIPWLGKEVRLRIDDRDCGRVYVCTADGEDRLICVAESNERIPANASSAHVREAVKGKRQHRKLLREYHQARPGLQDDVTDLVIGTALRNAKSAAPDPTLAPASIVPIRTPHEGQLPSIRKALNSGKRGRVAAGAESFDVAADTSWRELMKRATKPCADDDDGDAGDGRGRLPSNEETMEQLRDALRRDRPGGDQPTEGGDDVGHQ